MGEALWVGVECWPRVLLALKSDRLPLGVLEGGAGLGLAGRESRREV